MNNLEGDMTTMHKLIVSPFLGEYVVLRPGSPGGLKISEGKYRELAEAASSPSWFTDAVSASWGYDLSGSSFAETVLIRPESPYGYVRATYELNLGCNYECEHCYLGLKKFEGLSWPEREKLLYILRDAGVLWLQLTGGEPMIDKLFPEVYGLAYELGMMLTILSNGSRLANPKILELLTTHRPHDITLSMYGATEASYDGLTRRRGAYRLFTKGLAAAREAGLPLKLSLIVTNTNKDELEQMQAMADAWGIPHDAFVNMSPTIYGGPETLPTQSMEHLRKRKPFTGCHAGHTFFHVDPHGMASICKIGRDPQIPLMDEGVEGLTRLGAIADSLLLRQGGCTGCTLSGSCGTCMPLVTLYRKAKSPLRNYCQHQEREEVKA
ncbi:MULTISPECIES: radical SAM protein [Streptosporangium]|uniref:MoaA/NifB/PqqE/SkfB family radical SAM enzyme n=1 Tax=Streptosporangium brasiliense TaxID=47480 RepID=A0ABT9R656_9ACTN|nr:radical SAM protein [Streptosporangium brasiliense]MDP9863915.1 MoaA/NifB/PqqE/SkfB family radical SAM enzyme [Streptosporangium brasiliense]